MQGGKRGRTRRVTVLAIAGLLATLSVTARAEPGDPPCPPGQSPDPAGLVCVYLDKNTTALDAQTQQAQTEAAVAAQESSWLGTALELQHRLGDALPLWDAMWVGTHNSFNTIANSPASLSNNDSNQHVSLVDQLRLGVRGIEVDVHWNPSPWAGGAYAPVVCHARPTSEANAGCTVERLLNDELAPVRAWMDQHPNDVILLYVEDALEAPAAFDAATQMIDETLGDRVYKPAADESCPLLPMALKRADVLAAGKQVVIMSGCESGAGAWNSMVFDDSVRSEEGNPEFAGYPACTSPSVAIGDYGTKLVRFFEDSTVVSAAAAGGDPGHRITVAELRDMVRCGVNLFGLDQLDPADPRLEAMVWSWAPNEPSSAGSCAVSGGDDRFHAGACDGAVLRFACVDPATGAWFVTQRSGPQRDGVKACARERVGSVFAVPGSGNHAQRLADAKAAAAVTDVWVAYVVTAGGWSGNAA